MANQIQAGTMMVHHSAVLEPLELESEPYSRNWRSMGTLESSTLNRKVRDKGWNLFFMAGEIRTVVPAWGGQGTLRPGIMRLLAQTRLQHFNCLEVHQIRKLHFLGIPYISITARPRHLQKGVQIQSSQQRTQDAVTTHP